MSENAAREVTAVEPYQPQTTAVTPMDLLDRAMQRGMDAEALGKLLELQQRWEADQARKAFVQAMAAFKAEPLKIDKKKAVEHNGKYMYSHATLAQVVDAVVGALSKHGLSHRWETQQEGELITVSCVITHELGHSERTTLSGAPDKSGAKNSIQAVGSTVTYLQRYTLMAATGLAAHDMDDDGRKAEPAETITPQQVADIDALIQEVGADKAKFLKWARVESLDQIPAKSYETVVKQLEAKRRS